MFRKLMLGAVATVGLGFGAQEASAAAPVFAPVVGGQGYGAPLRAGSDFVVLVQRGPHSRWEQYARFDTMQQARRAERRLERDGFLVRIEQVRDRRW